LDSVLDLQYFSFYNPKPHPNPTTTHLPKHQTFIRNITILSVFDVQNINMCAYAHGMKWDILQVRNFAWHRYQLRTSNLTIKSE